MTSALVYQLVVTYEITADHAGPRDEAALRQLYPPGPLAVGRYARFVRDELQLVRVEPAPDTPPAVSVRADGVHWRGPRRLPDVLTLVPSRHR